MKLRQRLFSTVYSGAYPNLWDVLALILVFAIIITVAYGARQIAGPYHLGQIIPISLDPSHLPSYALRTVLRMFIAMMISLLFTFIFGTMAAKSRHAERIIIPLVDVLQSVPILGFLSISVPTFIGLFPNSMLGPECAAIFAIFTSQAWNMLMGFYQSLKTVPAELVEAADMFHLSAWQRYWRVEVPMTIPSLLWNMMLSMSAGWFFVVASEAISVANQHIMLPGVGSYIAEAIIHADKFAIGYAIVAMFIVILLYDQLIFRPLVAWSEKFKPELAADDVVAESWVVDLFRSTRWFQNLGKLLAHLRDSFININFLQFKKQIVEPGEITKNVYRVLAFVWNAAILLAIALGLWMFVRFISKNLSWHEVFHVFNLGLITGLRVMILIILCCVVWIPIGVWIGLRPKAAAIVQPLAQFFAAFPANLLFPIVVIAIIHYHLNVEIWTSPLMVLGTQWYILFNVIAGTTVMPKELLLASKLFGVKGWLKWRTLILPAIFPYVITGAMTAAGGAWNASIVAEVVSWGSTTLHAIGLGAYISETTTAGDVPREVLGIVVMCLLVVIINRLVWRPLYRLAEERFHVE